MSRYMLSFLHYVPVFFSLITPALAGKPVGVSYYYGVEVSGDMFTGPIPYPVYLDTSDTKQIDDLSKKDKGLPGRLKNAHEQLASATKLFSSSAEVSRTSLEAKGYKVIVEADVQTNRGLKPGIKLRVLIPPYGSYFWGEAGHLEITSSTTAKDIETGLAQLDQGLNKYTPPRSYFSDDDEWGATKNPDRYDGLVDANSAMSASGALAL